MERIVLFADRPRSLQILAVIVIPAVYGAICGFVLGASATAYIVLQVLAFIGGLLAGLEHVSSREGAARGAVGGLVYGAFLLGAHEISGAEAEFDIGDPEIGLLVVTTLGGALICAGMASVRRRSGG